MWYAGVRQLSISSCSMRVPDSTAIALGKALLWKIYSPGSGDVPDFLCTDVKMELEIALGNSMPVIEGD